MKKIQVNQLGYRLLDKKIFISNGDIKEFQVVDKCTGSVVMEGKTNAPVLDKSTEETVVYGDFSQLQTPGEYYIYAENMENSYDFTIDDKVYENAKDGLLKALYFQRCGIELEKCFADQWFHPACHIGKGVLYETPETELDVAGGWHDAGDYGRYVVPAAKAVADLLLAYDFFSLTFQNQINIPESGNNLPDILNEVKYELDWLFKMQDIKTGGVYHKVATQYFPKMIMPEVDLGPLVIYPISSTATGDFAAVMALASRIYEEKDKEFAQKCLQASEKAWNWLIEHPEPNLFKNPPDMDSGEYGDKFDLDERFWAAAEIYRTTGKAECHEYLKNASKRLDKTNSLGWSSVGGYGTIAYLFTDRSRVDTEVYDVLKSRFFDRAEELVDISMNDGYKVTLKSNQYDWGSNMTVLNNAMHLVISNTLKPNTAYRETVLHQWHYLFGVNSLSQCYVTGYGSKPIMNPHHRPSDADGVVEPVPGMVSGGPCSGMYDAAVRADCSGQPPAKCFTDHAGSYSTNEITIYWNSPAIFVAGFVNTIER